MAARYLSRTSGVYNAPLILLVLTLSLSTFTASLAQTLDRHVHDQTYYKVGSDMRIIEPGEATASVGSLDGQDQTLATTQSDISTTNSNLTISQPEWSFLPVSDYHHR